MMQSILLALLGTLAIFLIRQSITLYRLFRYFERIRLTVIHATLGYLQQTTVKGLDIVQLRTHLYNTLEKKKMTQFLQRLQVNWVSRDEIKLTFQLTLGWLKPAYSFKINAKEFKQSAEGGMT